MRKKKIMRKKRKRRKKAKKIMKKVYYCFVFFQKKIINFSEENPLHKREQKTQTFKKKPENKSEEEQDDFSKFKKNQKKINKPNFFENFTFEKKFTEYFEFLVHNYRVLILGSLCFVGATLLIRQFEQTDVITFSV